jgi:outer membrane protein OmpA-like peptidoglycan-associated protein
MRSTILSASLITASLLAAAHPAAAQGYFEVGGFGSHTRFDRTLPWSSANSGGARLSFGSGSGLASFVLEAEGSYFALGGASLPAVRYIPARARLLYSPSFGPVALMMGGGAVRNDFRTTGPGATSASDWGYTSLAGVRLGLGSYMALRLEGVLDYMTHPSNATPTLKRNTNRAVQAGLSFPLWTRRAPEPAKEPKKEPAKEPVKPTPVREPAAAPAPAPTRAQPVQADADRDGVPDARDACVGTQPGSAVDAAGCAVYRDSDGDAVIDQKDACAATPAGETVDGRGCPVAKDADRDGVPDARDRCASTAAGTPVNSVGCPEPVSPTALFSGSARTMTLRGVNFAPGRDELTRLSLAVLDDVARQLIDAPDVRVEVGGHTDAGGSYSRNVRLSLGRAEVVRAYLVMRGVAPDRVVARGYGPARPIAANSTPTGRSLNRRVELRRLD